MIRLSLIVKRQTQASNLEYLLPPHGEYLPYSLVRRRWVVMRRGWWRLLRRWNRSPIRSATPIPIRTTTPIPIIALQSLLLGAGHSLAEPFRYGDSSYRNVSVCLILDHVQPTHRRGPATAEKTSEPHRCGEDDEVQWPEDWDQEEDRLQAECSMNEATDLESGSQTPSTPPKRALQNKPPTATTKPKRPPQNKPTAQTASPLWDPELDEAVVSAADIKARWDKSLLSGGRSGSVSLSEKKRTDSNAAAKKHTYAMQLIEEADSMRKPVLMGNRTFSGLVEDHLLAEAFVGAESRADARSDQKLRLIEAEVVEQHLLGSGQSGPERGFVKLTLNDR